MVTSLKVKSHKRAAWPWGGTDTHPLEIARSQPSREAMLRRQMCGQSAIDTVYMLK